MRASFWCLNAFTKVIVSVSLPVRDLFAAFVTNFEVSGRLSVDAVLV